MGWFVSPKRALNAVSTIGVKDLDHLLEFVLIYYLFFLKFLKYCRAN